VKSRAESSLSSGDSSTGSVMRVSDALQMCKAQLLKHGHESLSQTGSFQQADDSYL